MRWILGVLLLLLAACEIPRSGYRVGEVQLLFPESTERWTYFYGEAQEVRLGERRLNLNRVQKEHLWSVPGSLWVGDEPLYREVGPALRPPGEVVRGVMGGLLEVRAQRDLRSVWLYDGVGWVQLTGSLREGQKRTLVQPASYRTPEFKDLTPGETRVLLREVLARRGSRVAVVMELEEPPLRALTLEPAPDEYRASGLAVQYGLRLDFVAPPPPSYRVLRQGGQSAYMESTPKAFLARDSRAFQGIWDLATGNLIPRPAPPQVDFSRKSVAAFFWGLKPTGGYTLSLAGVTYAGGTARVVLDLRTPPPGAIVTQALTSPYLILELEQVDRVVFTNPRGEVLAEARE